MHNIYATNDPPAFVEDSAWGRKARYQTVTSRSVSPRGYSLHAHFHCHVNLRWIKVSKHNRKSPHLAVDLNTVPVVSDNGIKSNCHALACVQVNYWKKTNILFLMRNSSLQRGDSLSHFAKDSMHRMCHNCRVQNYERTFSCKIAWTWTYIQHKRVYTLLIIVVNKVTILKKAIAEGHSFSRQDGRRPSAMWTVALVLCLERIHAGECPDEKRQTCPTGRQRNLAGRLKSPMSCLLIFVCWSQQVGQWIEISAHQEREVG